jgi:hypothetical protein
MLGNMVWDRSSQTCFVFESMFIPECVREQNSDYPHHGKHSGNHNQFQFVTCSFLIRPTLGCLHRTTSPPMTLS